MVKVKFAAQLEGKELDDYYELPLDRLGGSTETHVEYVDETSAYRLIMNGTNFTFGGTFDGTVNTMQFADDAGNTLLTVTGAAYDGSDMIDAFVNGGADGLLEYVFQGDDQLTGSKAGDAMYGGGGKDNLAGGVGRDSLDGGIGKDRLTGGENSDLFYFAIGHGQDTVSDFDEKGGGNKQDYVYLDEGTEYTERSARGGRDTVLDFGDGQTLTLLDVKRSDFSDADIKFVLEL